MQAISLNSMRGKRVELSPKSGNEEQPLKRFKTTHDSREDPTASIGDLPSDVLKHCFGFIPGSYVTVAPVSRHFFSNYVTLGIHESAAFNSADSILKMGRNRRTVVDSATVEAVSNDMKLTEYAFMSKAPQEFLNKVCRKAAAKGRKDILEFAAAFGMDVAQILEGCSSWGEVLAEEGNLDFLKYLHEKFDCFSQDYCPGWHKIAVSAASGGHVHILDWIYDMCGSIEYFLFDDDDVDDVIDAGNFEVLKWCNEVLDGTLDFERYGPTVAASGNVNALKYLFEVSSDKYFNKEISKIAANDGNIKILEFCHQNFDNPFNEKTCADSLHNKDKDQALKVLKWLRRHNCPWDESTCSAAASNNNMKALQWAKRNGCPWNQNTCNAAVVYNNLEILMFAHENGCEWSKDTYMYCLKLRGVDGLEPILKYLEENDCPKPHESN
ncbi:hypothetical protein CTEN210_04070 [Chaetoceros tenuissimus]|uniref:Uncharacterized protein n=1 Tax=Chaetoceros tenuissimus TaxID=426638 RepID=A0AAD3CMT0_9STRA|nr:hypothetical protein CTEN210_04070 [Chaetoceros tenuissimus]